MNLELAIVQTCGPEGCQVTLVRDGRSLETRYSALVYNQVKIRPGQMVAVDLQPATPEVAWRWYRARVVAVTQAGADLDDRGCRTLNGVRAAGMDAALDPGSDVWVTGMQGAWEIHDRVSGGAPAEPERLARQVLPRIANLLSGAAAA